MRAARMRAGLTLLEVAERCTQRGTPLSEGQASRIERGIYSGRPETRAAIAAVLGLDAWADFERTSVPSHPQPPAQPMVPCPHCGSMNDPARGSTTCRNCQLPMEGLK